MRTILFILLFISCSVYGQPVVDKAYWIERYMSVCYPLKVMKVNSKYGYRRDPFTKKKAYHNGIDLQCNYDNVYSMFNGIVDKIGSDKRSGNYMIIRYGDYTVSFCHLSRKYVNEGDSIYAGDPIALSGNSGRSTGAHLHMTCRKNGKETDPQILISYIKGVRNECIKALGGDILAQDIWSCKDFLEHFSVLAMEHQRKYGIPASVTLAQMALESDWGTSKLARFSNNYFGIKCSRQWLAEGKPYCLRDDDRKDEKFCSYSHVSESMEHHSKVLTSKRYKQYCDYPPTDYRRWLHGLKKAGYATASDYVASCLKIIQQYKLYQYDQKATNLTL